MQRLPQAIRDDIGKRGIRNSHLLSIAPTGTISLAFADNASNGIEPAFAWTLRAQEARSRSASSSRSPSTITRIALYRSLHGDAALTSAFVSALEISALDHAKMVAAVQPFIDSAISKTVNIPADYPFDRVPRTVSNGVGTRR